MTFEKCPVCCDTIAAQKTTTPSRSRLGLLNAYQGGVCRTIKAQYSKSSVANFLLQTTRNITTDGCASTILAHYAQTGPANMISLAHYPNTAVLVEHDL